MSLRVQIFCVIFFLSLLVVLVGSGLGLFVTRGSVGLLEKDNLRAITDLVDGFVSEKIYSLQREARTIARYLEHDATADGVEAALTRYVNTYGDSATEFLALTVVDRIVHDGGQEQFVITCSHGTLSMPTDHLAKKTQCVVTASVGTPAISTTVKLVSGELVFFVCVPVGDLHIDNYGNEKVKRLLCATLPGTYFADLLESFHFWKGDGDLILCDSEGTLIGTRFRKFVLEQFNFINLDRLHPNASFHTLSKFFQEMTSGNSDFNVHVLDGQHRISYYRPVTGSTTGWAIGTGAPVYSSPFRGMTLWMLVPGLVSLVLSCIVAWIAAGYLVKPYTEAIDSKEIAVKASESKSSFLANISHEMRTPLNAIIGLSELTLGSDDAKGEVAVNLEKIYNAGMTLLGTINDLLDISKIEAGRFDLIPVRYDLPSLINDTAALNSVRVGSKPIQFIMEIDENLPSQFFGDELRIKQMLNNLLSNAFKYTREGHVKWSITGKHGGGQFFLVFIVSDTGTGIREENQTLLFEEYSQIDAKANRTIEGTGLGLALVKKMATMMNGSVSVESKFGKGSTFTLQIQQQPLTDEVLGPEVAFNLTHMQFSQSKLARNARLTRLKLPYARVLIVDDVATNLDVARGMLKPYEMQVDSVMSGQAAVDAIREAQVRYNAVFMDHMMPGMDGIEATHKIREIGTEYAKTVPIIALTANAIVGNEEMFLSRGFQAFLSKPIDIMRLDVEIRRWVRDKAQESVTVLDKSASPSVDTEQPQAAWEIEGVDKAKALRQFGSNETFFIVLHSFVVNTPGLLDKIRTCTESQLPEYALLIHGIKGTCFGICADTVGKQAEALEHAARQGEFHYVSEHNALFIKAAEELIDCINIILQKYDAH